jgi:DNA-binding transcriptional regulator YdaS (Cro superfamily)
MNNIGLKNAVDYFGRQTKLARAIGVSHQMVDYWLKVAKRIPLEVAIKVSLSNFPLKFY